MTLIQIMNPVGLFVNVIFVNNIPIRLKDTKKYQAIIYSEAEYNRVMTRVKFDFEVIKILLYKTSKK